MQTWKYVHHIHFPSIKIFSASDYVTYVNKLSISEVLISARKWPEVLISARKWWTLAICVHARGQRNLEGRNSLLKCNTLLFCFFSSLWKHNDLNKQQLLEINPSPCIPSSLHEEADFGKKQQQQQKPTPNQTLTGLSIELASGEWMGQTKFKPPESERECCFWQPYYHRFYPFLVLWKPIHV